MKLLKMESRGGVLERKVLSKGKTWTAVSLLPHTEYPVSRGRLAWQPLPLASV